MSFATKEQLEELAVYIASQINVPTIGIGGGYAPIGTVIQYMGTTAPQDYLTCDGTIYNIADYPQLADFFEAQFGDAGYFGGNGSTTFAVPDLRGEFLRGTGTNSHANQGSGAAVGEHQDGTISATVYCWNGGGAVATFADNNRNVDSIISSTTHISNYSSTSAGETGENYTSRPTNTSVLYCIKAVVAGEVYSTDERVVGTWIDGNPIYQKTFTGSAIISSTAWNTDFNIPKAGMAQIVRAFGTGIPSNGGQYWNLIAALDVHNTYVGFMVSRDNSTCDVRTITLQYTKTTDG